jgi:gas vesicle protein
MNDPFEKKDNTGLILTIAIGAAVAAGLAYLFMTEDGGEALEKLKRQAKDGLKDMAAGIISDKTNISKKTVKKVADHVVK